MIPGDGFLVNVGGEEVLPREGQDRGPRAPVALNDLGTGVIAFPLRGHSYDQPRGSRSPRRSGIVNVNVEPTPIWLFTQILPPCNSTNFRARASPSPVPSTFLSAIPTCRNSSNTASWSSGA